MTIMRSVNFELSILPGIAAALPQPYIGNYHFTRQLAWVTYLFQDPQGAKYLRLLTIFAFGVYDDYLSAREELPPLDEGATKKLRLLTLASMASKEKLIAYADLQRSLHIDSVRELEDLIIEGASQNVVQGKLDQKNRRFEVEYAMARDIQKVRARIPFTHSRWFLLKR